MKISFIAIQTVCPICSFFSLLIFFWGGGGGGLPDLVPLHGVLPPFLCAFSLRFAYAHSASFFCNMLKRIREIKN